MGNKSTRTKAKDKITYDTNATANTNNGDDKFLYPAKEEKMTEKLVETYTRLPQVLCKIVAAYFIPYGRRILFFFEKYGECKHSGYKYNKANECNSSSVICELDLDECRKSRLLGDDVFKPIPPLITCHGESTDDYSDYILGPNNSTRRSKNIWAYNFKTGRRCELMDLSALEQKFCKEFEIRLPSKFDTRYSAHFILGRRHYFISDLMYGSPLVFVEEIKDEISKVADFAFIDSASSTFASSASVSSIDFASSASTTPFASTISTSTTSLTSTLDRRKMFGKIAIGKVIGKVKDKVIGKVKDNVIGKVKGKVIDKSRNKLKCMMPVTTIATVPIFPIPNNITNVWEVSSGYDNFVVCRGVFYMFICSWQCVHTFILEVDSNDESKIKWLTLEKYKLALYHYTVIADDIDGRVYFINKGLTEYTRYDDEYNGCRYFDVKTRCWMKMASLPESCVNVSFAIISEGYVILFEKFFLSKVEKETRLKFVALNMYCYDPVADSWSFITQIELRNFSQDVEFYPIACI